MKNKEESFKDTTKKVVKERMAVKGFIKNEAGDEAVSKKFVSPSTHSSVWDKHADAFRELAK